MTNELFHLHDVVVLVIKISEHGLPEVVRLHAQVLRLEEADHLLRKGIVAGCGEDLRVGPCVPADLPHVQLVVHQFLEGLGLDVRRPRRRLQLLEED